MGRRTNKNHSKTQRRRGGMMNETVMTIFLNTGLICMCILFVLLVVACAAMVISAIISAFRK